jgi:glycerate kinase
MKIIIASDSYKHSLSSKEVGIHLKAGLSKVLPDSEILVVPVADGGEGTVSALVDATGGEIIPVVVHDPLMREIDSFFGILGDGITAAIEMAAASGIELLADADRDPWLTTTLGTGELIAHALDKGCRKIILGIGGSATNDGGAGMAQALGVKLMDVSGSQLRPGGGYLNELRKIDLSELDERIHDCEIIIASDVNNPLTGPQGATMVFGHQKGANALMAEKLERKMQHFARLINEQLGIDIETISGAGAAGGLGGGLLAFTGASIENGFSVISKTVNLEEKICDADFVITGEGKIDSQTQYGKTPYGVAQLAVRHNKKVIAVAGTLGEGFEELYHKGFNKILSISDESMTLEHSISNAGNLLEKTGKSIGTMIKNKHI